MCTSTQREAAVKGTLPALSGSWTLWWSIEGSEGCLSWWTRKAHLRRLLGKATVRSTSHIPVHQKTTSPPRRCTSVQAGSVERVVHKINQMLVTQTWWWRTSFSNICRYCHYPLWPLWDITVTQSARLHSKYILRSEQTLSWPQARYSLVSRKTWWLWRLRILFLCTCQSLLS